MGEADRGGFDLERFVLAQGGGVHEQAVAEIRDGRKRSHWMWFVFPQLAGLGYSATARYYGIGSIEEARAFLAHPVLATRLQDCLDALEALPGDVAAIDVFGPVDTLKLRSSLTLFAGVAGAGSVFERLLARFFSGDPDGLTLALLSRER